MKPGDHLVASDTLHTHHGIYLSPGRVAQYGSDDDKRRARVEIVSEQAFARGRQVYVLDRPAAFSVDEIRRRVESRVGEQDYSLFGNNCEHFVNWCRTGHHKSRQVDRVVERSGAVGTKVVARAVAKGISKIAAKTGAKLASKTVVRAASPWLLVADAAQLGAEVALTQRGTEPEEAERAGQIVGLGASVGIGALAAGPVGACAGAGLWLAGELAGKCLTQSVARSKRTRVARLQNTSASRDANARPKKARNRREP